MSHPGAKGNPIEMFARLMQCKDSIRQDRRANRTPVVRMVLLLYRLGSCATASASSQAWAIRNLSRTARMVLSIPYALMRVGMGFDLPFESRLGQRPRFYHRLHGVFIHPNAVIGDDVSIYQGVTIGALDVDDVRAPVVEAGVLIGAGAVLLGPIVVGHGARVGAGAVIVRDVPEGATVVPAKARLL